jgi:Na+-driven multidrug efflux pump
VLAVILSKTSFGASGIWLAWPLGWVTACYLSVRFYLSGEWNHEEVNAEEPLALSE